MSEQFQFQDLDIKTLGRSEIKWTLVLRDREGEQSKITFTRFNLFALQNYLTFSDQFLLQLVQNLTLKLCLFKNLEDNQKSLHFEFSLLGAID